MKCPQCKSELAVPVKIETTEGVSYLFPEGKAAIKILEEDVLSCPLCRFEAHGDYWLAAEEPAGKRIYQNIPFIPKTHWLKIEPQYFYAVLSGNKRFEIRKNNRGYRVGHGIVLKMWDKEHGFYNKTLALKITYITDFPEGLRPGWVVIGWEKI